MACPGRRGAAGFVGGVVYLLLWIYGVVIDPDSPDNLFPVNTADNVLHLLLGGGMVGAGLVLRGIPRRR